MSVDVAGCGPIAFGTRVEQWKAGRRNYPISPLEGEMPGRAEGGAPLELDLSYGTRS
jgi:hypothetical protein